MGITWNTTQVGAYSSQGSDGGEAAGQGSALGSTREKGCTERGGGRGNTHVTPPPPSPPPTNTSNKREV